MSYFKHSILASIFMLSGCMESAKPSKATDDTSLEEKKQQALHSAETFYAFPSDGQSDIALNSNVIVTFSHPVKSLDDVVVDLTDSEGNSVALDNLTLLNDKQTITLKPSDKLKSGETYTLTYQVPLHQEQAEADTPVAKAKALLLSVMDEEGDDDNVVPEHMIAKKTMTFTTRSESNSGEFGIDANSMFPSDDLPFTTFTTLRLRFTHDVDIDSLVLGDSFSFKKVGSNVQVPGELIVKGRYLSFDPHVDLENDTQYELVMTSQVKNSWGDNLPEFKKTILARDVGQRSFSTMNVTRNTGEVSAYSGQLTNAVTIQSSLIGSKDTTYVDADLLTELANPGKFVGPSPLTIRKGAIMNASSLDVKVGGVFPTGFKTGDIRMTVISDATGYLIENTSSDHKYAPKQLRLLMDVAMTTDGYEEDGKINGKANGALSQDIMHLDVIGTVRSEGTRLIIDAVGEIDIKILGLETANAQVSFHMESYKAEDAPEIPVDTNSPILQSAYPGVNTSNFSLGDNVTFNFNEPLSRSSIQNLSFIDADNNEIPARIRQDGASVIIDPIDKLSSATNYRVEGNLVDLAGNSLYLQESFSTPHRVQESRSTSPLVMAMLPGYNCSLHEGDSAGYAGNFAGRCKGSQVDDYFTIFELQEDREIFVAFNQQLDEDSLVHGTTCDTGSFRVEVVNSSGQCIETVPGRMEYDNKILTFKPHKPWSDQGDNFYRYSLIPAPNKGLSKGQVNCKDGSAICNESGYPLQTTLLIDNKNFKSDEAQSGPNMRIPFRAKPADNLVFAPLMMPTTDSNYDARWDQDKEPVIEGNYAQLTATDKGGLITYVLLGCNKKETDSTGCHPDKSKTFINGFMPTEIGEYDPVHDRIPVKIHAQQLISSEVKVYPFLIGIQSDVPTATMIMRPIYPKVNGVTQIPEGYIIWNEEEQRLNFKIDLEVYMDSPFMHVTLNLPHNLHDKKIEMNLQGPVEFMPDGRMKISLRNKNNIDLGVRIAGSVATMTLTLASGAVSLQQISMPMK